jgi:hypothetical protein
MDLTSTAESLEGLRRKRADMQALLRTLQQQQGAEDAFELPGGPEAQVDRLRSDLIAIERAIAAEEARHPAFGG